MTTTLAVDTSTVVAAAVAVDGRIVATARLPTPDTDSP